MEEVDEFLNVIDKDNDGIVSKEEMTENEEEVINLLLAQVSHFHKITRMLSP